MRPRFVIRLVGLFLFLFSLSLWPPALVAAVTGDGQLWIFAESIALPLLAVRCCGTRRALRGNLCTCETFLVVALFWSLLGALGGLPFYLGGHLDPASAVFEAVSGFTTTGATTIVGIDALPPSILLYRQQLQWFGGLGVIVLAVAVLPMLGIGGMQPYRAETAGPMKEEKITPRIAHTARFMLIIYVSLTVICASAYWFAGMTLFDALCHSFATVSTGGFSTHDDSLAWFGDPSIEVIAMVFMLIGALSYNIHFLALYRRGPAAYWQDTQSRVFLITALLLAAATVLGLYIAGAHTGSEALRLGVFQAVSVITTTGFSTDTFAGWPLGLPVLLIFAAFIGGCAGSTSGGIKVIRIVVLFKVGVARDAASGTSADGPIDQTRQPRAAGQCARCGVELFFDLRPDLRDADAGHHGNRRRPCHRLRRGGGLSQQSRPASRRGLPHLPRAQ